MADTRPLVTYSVSSEPEACVLAVTGELDMATADEFALAAMRIIDTARTVPPVLDLSEVRFIDSTGLRALFTIHEYASGKLVLRRPSPVVMRLFEIAMPDVFTIE